MIYSYTAILSIFVTITSLILTFSPCLAQLVVLATYPDSDNFSFIALSCVYKLNMSSCPRSKAIGAIFYLNGTDIKE